MKTITGLKITGAVPIGLLVLVSLVFGIGESAGGDLGGLMHLVQGVILGLVLWLCWKRPLWGGIFLLGISLLRILALIPELFLGPPGSTWNVSLFILILIPLLSGGLFMLAGWLERKVALRK